MNLWMIISVLLLSACGRDVPVNVPPPQVPADYLVGCPGYSGPTPRTRGQFVDAAIAEKQGRLCANRKIEATAQILGQERAGD